MIEETLIPQEKFIPFVVTVKVETQRELDFLFCLSNPSPNAMMKFVNEHISGEDIDEFKEADEHFINRICGHIFFIMHKKLCELRYYKNRSLV